MGDRPSRQITQFCNTIESNGLVDLGWKFNRFTWSNGLSDEIYTKEQLDRALVTRDWLSLFRGATIETLVSGRSNHLPILLRFQDSHQHKSHRSYPFRFEAKWLLDVDCGKTVQEVWHNTTTDCSGWHTLLAKLSFCTRALTRWAK